MRSRRLTRRLNGLTSHLQLVALAVVVTAMAATMMTTTATAASAQPVIVSTTTSDVGPLERTEWIVQAGPTAIDTFRMTRLRRGGLPTPHGAILFLPSLGTTFELYEQRDPGRGFGSAPAEFFAVRGYDVWGYSPRFEGIPAGTCEAGVLDCSSFADWNIASMLDDISFIRDQIEAAEPGIGVVAGGLSLGGILAVAVADDDGARYDGVFPWEGMLLSDDPVVQGLNAGYCAALEAQIAGGFVADGVGNGVFKAINQYAEATPDGLTPIPLFPPFLTNRQVFVTTLTTTAPGPVSMPVPDYILAAGDPVTSELTFSSGEKIRENVLTAFNNYTPNPVVRDISCSLAGIETAYTDDLGSYTGSVLMIGGGRGFGAFMQDQLDAFTSASERQLLLEPEFGHIDHFFTLQHRQFVERPILRWLRGLW